MPILERLLTEKWASLKIWIEEHRWKCGCPATSLRVLSCNMLVFKMAEIRLHFFSTCYVHKYATAYVSWCESSNFFHQNSTVLSCPNNWWHIFHHAVWHMQCLVVSVVLILLCPPCSNKMFSFRWFNQLSRQNYVSCQNEKQESTGVCRNFSGTTFCTVAVI